MAEIRVDIDVDCGHRWCATSICCPPLLDRRNGFRGFVIVRMSDFKTNEYANLLGGTEFEPREENPMLGFRGASRYYSPEYREGFALECRAIRRLRGAHMGFTNVVVMIPFCRSPDEADRVLKAHERCCSDVRK